MGLSANSSSLHPSSLNRPWCKCLLASNSSCSRHHKVRWTFLVRLRCSNNSQWLLLKPIHLPKLRLLEMITTPFLRISGLLKPEPLDLPNSSKILPAFRPLRLNKHMVLRLNNSSSSRHPRRRTSSSQRMVKWGRIPPFMVNNNNNSRRRHLLQPFMVANRNNNKLHLLLRRTTAVPLPCNSRSNPLIHPSKCIQANNRRPTTQVLVNQPPHRPRRLPVCPHPKRAWW
mmetsp:Transcript_9115/g.18925  ORF Transcript_9115/g.18925 Transcript_9115/m.18925 type:complete len:228 (+) Transcript_9115:271-954(+)